MSGLWRAVFGAKAQVAIGSVCLVVSVFLWAYGGWLIHAGRRDELIDLIFHASMFYGAVACYAIVATGLGYRATERVEAKVEEADIEAKRAHVDADDVDVAQR